MNPPYLVLVFKTILMNYYISREHLSRGHLTSTWQPGMYCMFQQLMDHTGKQKFKVTIVANAASTELSSLWLCRLVLEAMLCSRHYCHRRSCKQLRPHCCSRQLSLAGILQATRKDYIYHRRAMHTQLALTLTHTHINTHVYIQ